ncbi:hypothetical protein FDB61_15875 [Clostridium botulinum]|nr:hypothetical protein [Clostridium botulinum]
MENIINETLAKRNKENYSFSDYKVGSATTEYNEVIADAKEKIEAAKDRVSPEGQVKLDKLFQWYKGAYANWINKHNANGANHVSWMIAGPSNYNMRKHEQWVAREGKLWGEYDNLKDITQRISTIIASDKIIKTSDPNALEKLKEKLAKAQEEHEAYKEHNKKAKKEGKDRFPSYVLNNSSARIRSIKKRIERLEKLSLQETKEIKPVSQVEGIKIVDNVEANRLQIIFDFKPDSDIRTKLKKNGFRWSPRNGAWQRFRSPVAEMIAQTIIAEI